MKPTDFSKYLTDFLIKYLPHEKGARTNTIYSYKDTFILYLRYMKELGIKAEQITMSMITKDNVISFLDWLETERKCTASTRNLRLAAIRSFVKYVQYRNPDKISAYNQVITIENKRTNTNLVKYLTIEGIQLLLEQPDINRKRGRRDLAILSLMYDTGARVSEIVNLSPSSIRFSKPYSVCITGKGGKSRIVPIMEKQLDILKKYMEENNLLSAKYTQHPLFPNIWGEKLTRAGISNILNIYVQKARKKNPVLIPEGISCHSLRHSRAMHLLQAGVELIYIRDFLGHSNVQTTEVYARADSKMKREAIEKAYIKVIPETEPIWQNNETLMDFLKSF